MGERVRITDVSPRDGLQNEAGIIPTAEKVELVRLLCQTGVDEVEVTSFVSPKWVPQLGDAGEVLLTLFPALFDALPSRWPALSVLVPNSQGMDGLLRVEESLRALLSHHPKAEIYYEPPGSGWPFVESVNLFVAASETFSKRNTNASIEENLDRVSNVLKMLRAASLPSHKVKVYISCAFACPFEGTIPPHVVAGVAQRLNNLGLRNIILGDTIGAADAASTVHLVETFRERFGRSMLDSECLALHLHDTFGRAAECVGVALDLGIRSFDGSVAGLGGCPYASTPGKRAPGNIATHTLVKTIHDAGFTTGVDLAKLDEAAAFATKIVAASRARAAAAGGQP